MGSANVRNSGVRSQLWIICLWIFMILSFFVTFSASCSNKRDPCPAGTACDNKTFACIQCSTLCSAHHDTLCSLCETHCHIDLLTKCREDALKRVNHAIMRPQPTSTDLPCQKVLNTVSYVVVGFVILAVIVVFAVALFYIRRELLCRQLATYVDPSQYALEEGSTLLLPPKCTYPLQRSLSVQADVRTLGVGTRTVETQTSILSLSMPSPSYPYFNQSFNIFPPSISLSHNNVRLSETEARNMLQDNFVSIENTSYDKLRPASTSYAHLGDDLPKDVVVYLVRHESVFSFRVNDNFLCICIFDGTSRSVELELRKALSNMYSAPFKIMRGTPKTMSTIPQADL